MRLNKYILACIAVCLLNIYCFGQSIHINEVVASNSKYFDEDGNSPDWIELYNSSNEDILLESWSLTDNINKPRKWPIPNYLLKQKSYLFLWASGKDRNSFGISKTIIDEGDSFKYIVPTQNPNASWTNINFDDSQWLTGNSGFGYADGDDETILPNGTRSVYLRKNFNLENANDIKQLLLDIDYDDAFVAYINGVEIARANINGNPPSYNGATITDHEALMYQGNKPERFPIASFENILVDGNNVLAIQAHNISNNSSDMTIIPFLSAVFSQDPLVFDDPPNILELDDLSMHTNFKISSEFETIYLINEEEIIADSIVVENLVSDISYGRNPFDGGHVYFKEPTPGTQNNVNFCIGINPSKIVFSHEGGKTEPINLSLTTNDPDDIIRYTTDASLPNDQSPIYNNPIPINENTVIRASIFKEDFVPSISQSRAYLINATHSLPIINLITEPHNLFDEEYGIYVLGNDANFAFPHFGANFWEDWERPMHFSFYENDGTHAISLNAGAKIFGGWSRGLDMKSLSIFARSAYGQKEIAYPLFQDLDYDVFQAIVLRNSGNDLLNSNMRDGTMTSLMKGSDLEVQFYRPAATYINGEYWGFYNMREKINEHFIASKHGVNPDSVDILEFSGEVIQGDNSDYASLIDFVGSNNLSNSSNYEFVTDQIDVDNFILYYLTQIYVDNQDWPGNNIKYWRPKDGKWRWILFDTDFGFGPWNDNAFLNNTLAFALESNGPNWPNPPWSTLLFRKLNENQEFRHKFINQFADEMNTRFLAQNVNQHISNVAANIESEIPMHYARWGESANSWNNELDVMKNFANNRLAIMKGDILSEYNLPAYHRLSIEINQEHRGYVKLNSLDLRTKLWSGDYFESVPVKLIALPLPGYVFSHWEGYVNSQEQEIEVDVKEAANIKAIFESGVSENTGVIINEINYKSSPDFNTGDWIELYNRGNNAVDISGWQLKDALDENSFSFPDNTVLPANKYVVIANDLEKFEALNPDLTGVLGPFEFGLSSEGDQVRLFDASDELVDEVTYQSIAPWPHLANGLGYTLELLHPDLENDLAINFGPVHLNGSPGKTNLLGVTPTQEITLLKGLMLSPNPANISTKLSFSLAESSFLKISLIDLKGQSIKQIIKTRFSEGAHEIDIDLEQLPSGTFLISLSDAYGKQRFVKLVKS